MNIAVVLRLMPSLGDDLDLNEEGTDIARDDVGMVINEFDDQALEEAVLIKEATGATVTALALRAQGVEQALRVALARGADRVVVVEAGDLDPYDSRTSANALAVAVQDVAPDLVLTGVQTPYDVFGQTAPILAATLGWPQASVVSNVTIRDRKAHVLQEYSGGHAAVIELGLPAVIGVQSASSPPRYVSMSRLRQAMTSAADMIEVKVAPTQPRARLVSLGRPPSRERAAFLEGQPESVAAQIIDVLRQRGVVTG